VINLLDVRLVPTKIKDYQAIVVIDVLRATTTMITAISNGAQFLVPVETVEQARIYRNDGFLLCGERGGVKPEDFDLGNSPLEYTKDVVKDKKLVITTTNGTKALAKAREHSKNIILGAFVNFSKTLEYIKKFDDILFVCSGNDGEESFEDTQVAGAFIEKLVLFKEYELSDSALISLNFWKSIKMPNFTGKHSRVLKAYGFKDDIIFSQQLDIFNTVVIYDGDKVIKGE
jgi:2-phosphosulfolactate phosphatase